MINISFDQINSDLNSEYGGVRDISMRELRDAKGVKKLGQFVAEGIAKELNSRGIGYYDPQNPVLNGPMPSDSQNRMIRIYRLGDDVEKLLKAVLSISDNQLDNEKWTNDLRIFSSNANSDILSQIRELVCS